MTRCDAQPVSLRSRGYLPDQRPVRTGYIPCRRRKGKRHNRSPGASGVLGGLVGLVIGEDPYRGGLTGDPHQEGEVSHSRITVPLARALPDRQATNVITHAAIVPAVTDK